MFVFNEFFYVYRYRFWNQIGTAEITDKETFRVFIRSMPVRMVYIYLNTLGIGVSIVLKSVSWPVLTDIDGFQCVMLENCAGRRLKWGIGPGGKWAPLFFFHTFEFQSHVSKLGIQILITWWSSVIVYGCRLSFVGFPALWLGIANTLPRYPDSDFPMRLFFRVASSHRITRPPELFPLHRFSKHIFFHSLPKAFNLQHWTIQVWQLQFVSRSYSFSC